MNKSYSTLTCALYGAVLAGLIATFGCGRMTKDVSGLQAIGIDSLDVKEIRRSLIEEDPRRGYFLDVTFRGRMPGDDDIETYHLVLAGKREEHLREMVERIRSQERFSELEIFTIVPARSAEPFSVNLEGINEIMGGDIRVDKN